MSEDKKPDEEKVNDSRLIPHDKDFDLAAESGQLKEKLKQAEDGLKSGKRIAEERVWSANDRADDFRRERNRFAATTLFVAILSLACVFSFGWHNFDLKDEVEDLKTKLVVAEKKSALITNVVPDQEASVRYWQDRAWDLQKELKNFASIPPSLKEATLHEKIEKLGAEKAELQKKLDEVSATTAVQKAERLAQQKKVAEELVRSWCAVPTPQPATAPAQPAPTEEKNQNISVWAIAAFVVLSAFAAVAYGVYSV